MDQTEPFIYIFLLQRGYRVKSGSGCGSARGRSCAARACACRAIRAGPGNENRDKIKPLSVPFLIRTSGKVILTDKLARQDKIESFLNNVRPASLAVPQSPVAFH